MSLILREKNKILKYQIYTMLLETHNLKWNPEKKKDVFHIISKIKTLKEFFKLCIFLNKETYLGFYSLHIIPGLNEKNKEKINEILLYYINFNDKKLNKLINFEFNSMNYFFDKVSINSDFEPTIRNLNICREELFNYYNLNNKYLFYKKEIVIKKGNTRINYKILDLIFQYIETKNLDSKIKNFIKEEIVLVKRYIL